MENEVKDKVGGVLARLAKYKYVFLVLIVGVALLVFPTGRGESASVPEPEPERRDDELETRLEEILSLIDGAGRVRVLLTRSNDGESVLASDSEQTQSGESGGTRVEERHDAVIVSTGSGTNDTVEVKYLYPEFRGAVVVAEGADSARVSLDLLDAVTAATGLPADSVKIVKMK